MQVRAAQLIDDSIFFDRCEEALANVIDQVLLFDLLKVAVDLLFEREAMLALAHELRNLLLVIILAKLLVLLQDLNASAAVTIAHMFNELGAIADKLTFDSVNEGAGPLIEAV